MCHGQLDSNLDSALHSVVPVEAKAVCTKRLDDEKMVTGRVMNGLLWIAQLVLASVFLVTGHTKLFAYERLVKTLAGRSKSG
jgi:hypothetical protein